MCQEHDVNTNRETLVTVLRFLHTKNGCSTLYDEMLHGGC